MNVDAMIDPEIAAALASIPRMADFALEDLPTIRQQRRANMPQPVLTDAVERNDHSAPGRGGAPEVIMRVHRPKGVSGELPAIFWMHGGGYMFGSYDMEDLRFDKWCAQLNCVGISVEYRLSPETPYPGPLEDCYAGLSWVYANAAKLGINRAKLGIGGASAGGGLAAGLALITRDRGEIPLAFQMLVYPMIDDRLTTPSSAWEVPVWNPAANKRGWGAYLGELAGGDVPAYAAPARADNLAGLPPACIVVGALDGFLDEDVDYALGLTYADVPTELHVYPGAPHGFDSLAPGTPIARRARAAMEDWLARQFEK